MRTYKRARIAGGVYFFTVNLTERRGNTLLVDHIATLRESFRVVCAVHPFDIDAVVVMPDHLHCIWRMPVGDDDYATRWRLIKARFSAAIPSGEYISSSRARNGERGIWQRRYWEHVIRDETDWRRHVDYIHYNPMKHGHVKAVREWPHSSFRRFVQRGEYPANWTAADSVIDLDCE